MKTWQKIILLALTIAFIGLLIHWWMSYDEMEIFVKNERNESISIHMDITKMDGSEIYNISFILNANESIELRNITTWAGNYYIHVVINGSQNYSVKEKIKYGKYFERIDVIVGSEGVEILNRKT
ncbi:MAG: hypothetical protein DRP55_10825 [Spirochaetes bacterium]|nr:MAG: hypothetical protein DRP55_10825 [Spirochaetota bacterium]